MPITAERDPVTHLGEDAGMDVLRSLYVILILPLLAFSFLWPLSDLALCLASPMGGVKKDLVTHTCTFSAEPPAHPTSANTGASAAQKHYYYRKLSISSLFIALHCESMHIPLVIKYYHDIDHVLIIDLPLYDRNKSLKHYLAIKYRRHAAKFLISN